MPSILFICTANQFRSPIAAACLLKTLQSIKPTGDWEVESAGTWTKDGIRAPEFTRQAIRQLGLPGLENHRTRQVNLELLSRFDLSIVMEAGHKEALSIEFPAIKGRVRMLSEIVKGAQFDIQDPAIPGVDPQEVAKEIMDLIDEGAKKIILLAEALADKR